MDLLRASLTSLAFAIALHICFVPFSHGARTEGFLQQRAAAHAQGRNVPVNPYAGRAGSVSEKVIDDNTAPLIPNDFARVLTKSPKTTIKPQSTQPRAASAPDSAPQQLWQQRNTEQTEDGQGVLWSTSRSQATTAANQGTGQLPASSQLPAPNKLQGATQHSVEVTTTTSSYTGDTQKPIVRLRYTHLQHTGDGHSDLAIHNSAAQVLAGSSQQQPVGVQAQQQPRQEYVLDLNEEIELPELDDEEYVPAAYNESLPLKTCGKVTWQDMLPRCDDNFYGCYNRMDRKKMLDRDLSFKIVPCGFHSRGAMDTLRERFASFDKCNTLIYTANFGGQGGKIQLPPAKVRRRDGLGTICYVLILDKTSMLYFTSPRRAPQWNVILLDGVMPYVSSAHSYKVIKLLSNQFLPDNIERSLFIDTHVLHPNHTMDALLDSLVAEKEHPITMFAHPYTHDMMSELSNAARRIFKHRKYIAAHEIGALKQQLADYRSYGYPKEPALHIQSNLIYRSYTEKHRSCSALIECAWFGELDLFSYRDQPSITFILDQLDLWSAVNVRPHGEKLSLITDYERIGQEGFHALAQFDPPFVYDEDLRSGGVDGVLRKDAKRLVTLPSHR